MCIGFRAFICASDSLQMPVACRSYSHYSRGRRAGVVATAPVCKQEGAQCVGIGALGTLSCSFVVACFLGACACCHMYDVPVTASFRLTEEVNRQTCMLKLRRTTAEGSGVMALIG